MKRRTRLWLKGLIAAAISGSANALAATVTTAFVAPGVADGLRDMVMVAATAAVSGAAIGVFGYFKRSPLPDENGNGLELPPKS